jgi:hypothetical protein
MRIMKLSPADMQKMRHHLAARDSIINRRRLRGFALAEAEQRHHKFNRVSEEFFIQADAHLKAWVRAYVHALPSVGKTIK